MLAVEVGNFGWMLALGRNMAVEKNLPWGLGLLVGVLPALQAGSAEERAGFMRQPQ